MEAAIARRAVCGGCGSGSLDVVLDLGPTPLADRFLATPDEAEQWFPLLLAVCTSCWLLQLTHIVADAELWDGRYAFLTGASPASQAYFRDWAAWAQQHASRGLTVEIACNDGTLLRHFRGERLGVEPSALAADAARAAGVPVRQELFTEAEAIAIRAGHGPAALVIACNVVAHAADPGDFLRGVRTLLASDGVAVIEFQDAAELVAGCLFDHVYHEHRFFFSLDSFASVAAAAGLAVVNAVRTPAQGGSLRVTLRQDRHRMLPHSEPWLRERGVYDSLQPRAQHIRSRLLRALEAGHRDGRVTAGYGATAKSCTLLNYCGIGPRDVAYVADLTPHKQGRYTPGSRIPVVPPPARDPDTWLLLAWNYLLPVLRRETAFTGSWIVPFTGGTL